MALSTGSPIGASLTQETTLIDSAPDIFIQDYRAGLRFNPDSDGFYWALSGTTTYPYTALGCLENVQLADNLTMNDVRCDAVGVTDVIQQRNYLELTLAVKTLFPLSTMRDLLRTGAVTTNAGADMEKVGVGVINNSRRQHVYIARVYDEDVGAYFSATLHKCKFVDAWTMQMPFGQEWSIQGLKVRAFADTTMPAAQRFATFVRFDPTNL